MCATTSGWEIVCPPPIGSASFAHARPRRSGGDERVARDGARSRRARARRATCARAAMADAACSRVDSRAMAARLPGRRRRRRRADADPGHRRGAAARRRRLRGHPALRRAAVRARRPPRADGAARPSSLRLPLDVEAFRATPRRCSARPRRGDALLRLLVTRGGRRHRARSSRCPTAARRSTLALVEYAPHAHARRRQVAVVRGEHARDAAGAGARRRRGAARHAARPRCSRGRRRRSSTCSAASCARRRSSDHILDSITRRRLLERRSTSRERSVTRRRARRG